MQCVSRKAAHRALLGVRVVDVEPVRDEWVDLCAPGPAGLMLRIGTVRRQVRSWVRRQAAIVRCCGQIMARWWHQCPRKQGESRTLCAIPGGSATPGGIERPAGHDMLSDTLDLLS